VKATEIGISADPEVMSLSKRVEGIVRRVYERKFAPEAFREAKEELDHLRDASTGQASRDVVQGGFNDLAAAKRIASARSGTNNGRPTPKAR
jgi:hypothetical protein